MVYLERLSREQIKNLIEYVRKEGKEISICVVGERGLRYNRGDVVEVERAGRYGECECIIHTHPNCGGIGEVCLSGMPSSSDISIVINEFKEMVERGEEKGLGVYSDIIIWEGGAIEYWVRDIEKAKRFLEGVSRAGKSIEEWCRGAMEGVIEEVKREEGIERIEEIKDMDRFLDKVKEIWYDILNHIGIGIYEIKV